MFQIDNASAAAQLPVPAPAGTPGFFTEGNPATGVAPTVVSGDFLNMVMMELIAIVVAGGLTPSKTSNNQVLMALKALFGGSVTVVNGETTIPLPGGYFIKLGTTPIGGGLNSLNGSITFQTKFPNACIGIVGNADGIANSQWAPIVVMIQPPLATGAVFTADSANVNQAITAGRNIRWIALGN